MWFAEVIDSSATLADYQVIERFILRGPVVTIGRKEGSMICFANDLHVSRSHAELDVDPVSLTMQLRDLGASGRTSYYTRSYDDDKDRKTTVSLMDWKALANSSSVHLPSNTYLRFSASSSIRIYKQAFRLCMTGLKSVEKEQVRIMAIAINAELSGSVVDSMFVLTSKTRVPNTVKALAAVVLKIPIVAYTWLAFAKRVHDGAAIIDLPSTEAHYPQDEEVQDLDETVTVTHRYNLNISRSLLLDNVTVLLLRKLSNPSLFAVLRGCGANVMEIEVETKETASTLQSKVSRAVLPVGTISVCVFYEGSDPLYNLIQEFRTLRFGSWPELHLSWLSLSDLSEAVFKMAPVQLSHIWKEMPHLSQSTSGGSLPQKKALGVNYSNPSNASFEVATCSLPAYEGDSFQLASHDVAFPTHHQQQQKSSFSDRKRKIAYPTTAIVDEIDSQEWITSKNYDGDSPCGVSSSQNDKGDSVNVYRDDIMLDLRTRGSAHFRKNSVRVKPQEEVELRRDMISVHPKESEREIQLRLADERQQQAEEAADDLFNPMHKGPTSFFTVAVKRR